MTWIELFKNLMLRNAAYRSGYEMATQHAIKMLRDNADDLESRPIWRKEYNAGRVAGYHAGANDLQNKYHIPR